MSGRPKIFVQRRRRRGERQGVLSFREKRKNQRKAKAGEFHSPEEMVQRIGKRSRFSPRTARHTRSTQGERQGVLSFQEKRKNQRKAKAGEFHSPEEVVQRIGKRSRFSPRTVRHTRSTQGKRQGVLSFREKRKNQRKAKTGEFHSPEEVVQRIGKRSRFSPRTARHTRSTQGKRQAEKSNVDPLKRRKTEDIFRLRRPAAYREYARGAAGGKDRVLAR